MATSTLGSGTLVLAGTTSGTTTVTATAVAGTTTLTLPAATDTLVGKATTDTLTNKTLTGAVMNGTLGATTPSTVAATTLTTSSTVTHNGGTANGVAYLDGSKVLTTGSALVFDGTNLGVGATSIPAGFRMYASGGSMLLDNTYTFRQKDSAGNNTLIFALSSGNNLEFGSGQHTGGMAITTGNSNITFTTNSAERMRLDSSGNLLVGTTTALGTLTVNGTVSSSYTGFYIGESTYRMQVASGQIQIIASSGGVYLPSGGTGWGSLSDENLKNITGLITNGIDAVKSLRAARYTWKSDETNKPQVGLIAQDIKAVLPEAVDENSDGFLGVRYSDVIPLLVAAIQEQQALITQLQADVALLKGA